MDMNSILQRLGVDYEELTSAERDTLFKWLDQASARVIQPDDVKQYMRAMIESVQMALVDESEYVYEFFGLIKRENREHVMLKARLKNYILLLGFLESPERAKRALDQHIQQMKPLNKMS